MAQPHSLAARTTEEALRRLAAGDQHGALACLEGVLSKDPNDVQANHLSGVALFQLGERDAGFKRIFRAVAGEPQNAEIWANLGNALRAMDRLGDSLEACQTAVALDPGHASAHSTLAAVLRGLDRLDDSLDHGRVAVHLDPHSPEARINLGAALQAVGEIDAAVDELQHARGLSPDDLALHSNLLFTLQYSDSLSGKDLKASADEFGARFPLDEVLIRSASVRKVGYISGDLRRHPVGYFLEPVLRVQRSQALEICLISTRAGSDDWTERLESRASARLDVSALDDKAACAAIRQLGLDVLIDLSGHTAYGRPGILGRRAAPVQVSWLGWSGTTGLRQIDFIVGDEFVTPSRLESAFVEKCVQLPHGFLALDPDRLPLTASVSANRGPVVFGSFNNTAKVSASVIDLWSRVLQTVPDSRMVLKYRFFASSVARARVLARFAENGIDEDRIEFIGWTSEQEHFECFSRVDAMLDTWPYSGATTTAESLALGVPVVTLTGDRYASGMSASMLAAAGCGVWVTETSDDYVAAAAEIAQSIDEVRGEREALSRQVRSSSLTDTARFTDGLTSALRAL